MKKSLRPTFGTADDDEITIWRGNDIVMGSAAMMSFPISEWSRASTRPMISIWAWRVMISS